MAKYAKVTMARFLNIKYVCPNKKQVMTVTDWSEVSIVGPCADDEYPSEHRIEVSCQCGQYHEMEMGV